MFDHKRALQDMERWKNMPITSLFVQISKCVKVDIFDTQTGQPVLFFSFIYIYDQQ